MLHVRETFIINFNFKFAKWVKKIEFSTKTKTYFRPILNLPYVIVCKEITWSKMDQLFQTKFKVRHGLGQLFLSRVPEKGVHRRPECTVQSSSDRLTGVKVTTLAIV